MPELRKDPITERWVIISTERSKRPSDFSVPVEEPYGDTCPFCHGNEEDTPPEIMSYRPENDKNGTGWTIRVVPNKFPALIIEGKLDKEGEGVFDRMNGVGAHEVIIETPKHNYRISERSLQEIEDIFWAYRDRLMDLRKDPRFKYVMIFKNQGQLAGASLEHPHSQLIALPIVPRQVVDEVAGAKRYYNQKERCIYCDIVRQEIQDGIRVIFENAFFLVIEPYAPRFPFETWILPKTHDSSFEDCQKREYRFLAEAIKTIMSKLDKTLSNPPYNYILHTSPFQDHQNPYYHWHIELMPTLTKVAGFEWGSGFYINSMPPERAAETLRAVEL